MPLVTRAEHDVPGTRTELHRIRQLVLSPWQRRVALLLNRSGRKADTGRDRHHVGLALVRQVGAEQSDVANAVEFDGEISEIGSAGDAMVLAPLIDVRYREVH